MKTMKKEKLDAERVWKEFEEASGGNDQLDFAAAVHLVTCLSVEDQFHKMAKLGSVLRDRSTVGHFLNRFRVFDRRFVVGAVHDD